MHLRRVPVIAGAVSIVVAGAVAVYVWQAHGASGGRPGDKVSLRNGTVTFRAPAGWKREACPSGDASGCIIYRPPGGDPGNLRTADPATADAGDEVSVIVSAPDAKAPEGDPSMLLLNPTFGPKAGATYFTRDGVRFVRTHLDAATVPFARPASTMVLGVLPDSDQVTLSCVEKAVPSVVRGGCDVVINSLHVST